MSRKQKKSSIPRPPRPLFTRRTLPVFAGVLVLLALVAYLVATALNEDIPELLTANQAQAQMIRFGVSRIERQKAPGLDMDELLVHSSRAGRIRVPLPAATGYRPEFNYILTIEGRSLSYAGPASGNTNQYPPEILQDVRTALQAVLKKQTRK